MEITASPNAPAPSRAAQHVRMSTEHQQYSPQKPARIIRQYATDYKIEISTSTRNFPK